MNIPSVWKLNLYFHLFMFCMEHDMTNFTSESVAHSRGQGSTLLIFFYKFLLAQKARVRF